MINYFIIYIYIHYIHYIIYIYSAETYFCCRGPKQVFPVEIHLENLPVLTLSLIVREKISILICQKILIMKHFTIKLVLKLIGL